MKTVTETIKETIKAADLAISSENFDELMEAYTEDACFVAKPGIIVSGKNEIRQAFVNISEHFNHSLIVTQGEMHVIPAGDVALVIMETNLQVTDASGDVSEKKRRATYVYKNASGRWLCAVDNSYGTALLDE
jgi:uncharacterized protein (TIGR02246 family)